MHCGRIIVNMNELINNNISFDNNFEYAYNLCLANCSHIELINMLKNGNIAEKQIAALKMDYINNIDDVNALLNNLTGCDGKIREAVAFKINYFLLNDKNVRSLFAESSADVFAKASIDINANICRLIVDSAFMLKSYKVFSLDYVNQIVNYIYEALIELDKFVFKDKKYVINKQLFKLYWCLEALNFFPEYVSDEDLKKIMTECSKQSEYTVREKVASLIQKTNIAPEVRKLLSNDDNYYVQQMLHHPCFF